MFFNQKWFTQLSRKDLWQKVIFEKVARLTMSGINQCNIACKIGSMKRKKVTEGQQNVFQKWLMQLRK